MAQSLPFLLKQGSPTWKATFGKDNLMKKAFFTVMLLCLFVLGTHNARAQVYPSGYYDQSWGGTEEQYDPYNELESMHYNQLYPQQYDPYYDLEAMHHKYLPQFQPPYVYPYPLCCVPGGY